MYAEMILRQIIYVLINNNTVATTDSYSNVHRVNVRDQKQNCMLHKPVF